MNNVKPLAVTLGDPAGIGPEVAAKLLAGGTKWHQPLLFVGTQWALAEGARAAGIALPEIQSVGSPVDLTGPVGLLDMNLPKGDFRFGAVSAACGEIAVRSVEAAAGFCIEGAVSGMVTCPINKEAIHAAGYINDIGHQEILARLTRAEWTATMLMTPGLRVVHLSTHKSLIKAVEYVTRDNVVEKLRLTQETLTRWGLEKPRIAVAALNPHGGEGGLLGSEEIEELAPAVLDARSAGIDAQRSHSGGFRFYPGH